MLKAAAFVAFYILQPAGTDAVRIQMARCGDYSYSSKEPAEIKALMGWASFGVSDKELENLLPPGRAKRIITECNMRSEET